MVACLLWWVEYRIDVKIEKQSSIEIQNLNSKLDSLNSIILHNDSNKMISLTELRENKNDIDSLIHVLKETKQDSMNINEALEFLKNYIKK